MKLERLMGLSEYAKSRKARGLPGGTLQAVLNACNDGRISFVKAGRNRMVDPMAADRQWLNNTDPTRYGADAYAAALGIETPPPPPPPPAGADPARAIGQAEALAVCFANLPLAAGMLVHELGMEPLPALRAAVSAVSGCRRGFGLRAVPGHRRSGLGAAADRGHHRRPGIDPGTRQRGMVRGRPEPAGSGRP